MSLIESRTGKYTILASGSAILSKENDLDLDFKTKDEKDPTNLAIRIVFEEVESKKDTQLKGEVIDDGQRLKITITNPPPTLAGTIEPMEIAETEKGKIFLQIASQRTGSSIFLAFYTIYQEEKRLK